MSNRHVLAALIGLATGVLAVAGGQRDAPTGKKEDAKMKLEGTYTIVSGEHGGKPIPDSHFKGSLVKFTDKAVVGTDKDRKEFFAATYTIDTSKTPWAIHMTSTMTGDAKDTKEKKAAEQGKSDRPDEAKKSTSGLIKQDGDTVTVVYALPGGKTPTEFKAGENQHLFVMKKTDKKQD